MSKIRVGYLLLEESPRHVSILWLSSSCIWTWRGETTSYGSVGDFLDGGRVRSYDSNLQRLLSRRRLTLQAAQSSNIPHLLIELLQVAQFSTSGPNVTPLKQLFPRLLLPSSTVNSKCPHLLLWHSNFPWLIKVVLCKLQTVNNLLFKLHNPFSIVYIILILLYLCLHKTHHSKYVIKPSSHKNQASEWSTHQRRLVIAMEDVDEICYRQHTCDRKACKFPVMNNLQRLLLSISFFLPTNLCTLLSHRGAALKPFATSAKKAFFTCGGKSIHFSVSEWGCARKPWVWKQLQAHLELGVEYDQFTAGWNGAVAAVALHELHVDCGVSACEESESTRLHTCTRAGEEAAACVHTNISPPCCCVAFFFPGVCNKARKTVPTCHFEIHKATHFLV